MPGQTKKATLIGKFGAEGRAAAAKGAKTEMPKRQRDLPAGVNGVARLIECYLAEYDAQTKQKQADGSSAAGQVYLYLVGSVETPKTFQVNGTALNIEGVQFRQFIPICKKGSFSYGRPVTFEECIKLAQDELRLIGGDQFDATDMDKAIALLANAKPKPAFAFRTQKRKEKIDPKTKKPYPEAVDVKWLGCEGLANYKPETESAVTEEAPADEAPADEAPAEETPAETFDETNGGQELGTLAESADAGDEDAAAKLGDLAQKAGLTEEEIGSVSSWVEVLDLMQAKDTGAADEPKEWTKGDECLYAPMVKGPGNKERPGKAVKCKITGLNKDKSKVALVAKDDAKKTWKDVPVDAITRPE